MGKAVTREQIHEILDLVLDINGIEQRQQSITGDKPTAFMWINGHVCDIDIWVYKNGWSTNANPPDVKEIIKLLNGKTRDSNKTFDDVIKALQSIKNDRRQEAERSQTR